MTYKAARLTWTTKDGVHHTIHNTVTADCEWAILEDLACALREAGRGEVALMTKAEAWVER